MVQDGSAQAQDAAAQAQEITEQAEQETQQILRELENIDVVAILVTLVLAWMAVELIQRTVPWLADRLPNRFRLYLLPVVPIVRTVILLFAVVRILFLVIQPTPQNVLTIAGALAVAIGFAFKDYVSSIVAGIVSIYERPYRAGDWVNIGGDYGEVKSVGLRAIQIVRPDDTAVTIPHSRIWTDNIANANSGQRDHLVTAEFYADPTHDGELARRLLYDVAITSPYTQLERPITVLAFAEPWATHYRLRAYPIDGRNEFLYITDLTVRGKRTLAEAGIKAAQLPPLLDPNSPSPPRLPPAV